MFDFLGVTYHTKYLKLTSSIRGLSVFELFQISEIASQEMDKYCNAFLVEAAGFCG